MNKYNEKYKLIGFTSTQGVLANIMIFSTGKVIQISCSKLEKSDIADDLNRHELNQIHQKMYRDNSSITSYDMKDRKQSYWVLYTIISTLLTVVFLLANITGPNPIEIKSLNIVITGGLLIYPLTFILIDTLNEFYGIQLAKISILLTLIINVVFFGILWMLSVLPSMSGLEQDQYFSEMLNRIITVLFASSVSYFVSENINSYMLQKIKKITNSRYLFIRVLCSTIVAAAIDSFLFTYIAFYGIFEIEVVKNIMLTQFSVKIIYAIIGVFPIYLTRSLFKKITNIDCSSKNNHLIEKKKQIIPTNIKRITNVI